MTKLQLTFVLLLTTISIHLRVQVQTLMFLGTDRPPNAKKKNSLLRTCGKESAKKTNIINSPLWRDEPRRFVSALIAPPPSIENGGP